MLRKMKAMKHCYLWIAPFFLLFAVFYLCPAVYGLYISLTKTTGFETPVFVGLANYKNLFADPKFGQALLNTIVLWALIVPARTFLALVFASMLNANRMIGKRIYTVIVLIPYITASAIVAIVFRILFVTNGGIVNVVLGRLLGIGPIGWLDTTAMSKVSIAVMNIWRMTGYFSLVLLAGMQKIPQSVHEACRIDGAGPIRKFFRVTIPLLSSEIFFVVLISTIWICQNVTDVMLLTGGGPIFSSTTLVYYMYQNAFEFSKLGYGSAIAYMLFLMLLAVSGLMSRFYYRKAEDGS